MSRLVNIYLQKNDKSAVVIYNNLKLIALFKREIFAAKSYKAEACVACSARFRFSLAR